MIETSSTRWGRPTLAAKWLIVAALGAVAALLSTELTRSVSSAGGQTGQPIFGGHVQVVPGQITRDAYGVYLVDTQNGTMCVYQYLATTRTLRLVASRKYVFDLQLDDYNTQPSPSQIREWVEQQKRPPVMAPDGEGAASRPNGS
jgi:hypothetical protein